MRVKVKVATVATPPKTLPPVAKPPMRKLVGAEQLTVKSGVWDLYRDGVTQGLLANFLMCPEKARLASVIGLTSVRSSGALAFGSLVHDILDQVYTYVREECEDPCPVLQSGAMTLKDLAIDRLEGALRVKEKEDRQMIREKMAGNPEELNQLEENYAMAEGILAPYFEKWTEDFDAVEWVELEKTFAIPYKLRNGKSVTIRGKRDGVVRSRKTGRLQLFETKTKGRIDEDAIMDKLTIDLQVMLYLWSVWKEYGEMPEGVIYNIMRKPQLRQKQQEPMRAFAQRIANDVAIRPDFYFIRYFSPVVESDLKRWVREFDDMMNALVDWYDGKFHYRNSSACSMGGVNCQFLSVCARGDRNAFKVKDTPFPELKEAEE